MLSNMMDKNKNVYLFQRCSGDLSEAMVKKNFLGISFRKNLQILATHLQTQSDGQPVP